MAWHPAKHAKQYSLRIDTTAASIVSLYHGPDSRGRKQVLHAQHSLYSSAALGGLSLLEAGVDSPLLDLG